MVLLVTNREFAATILLVVETILLQQLVASLLQAPFTPVLGPKSHRVRTVAVVIHRTLRSLSGTLNLLQTLPTAGGQRSGKIADSQFLSLPCRLHEAQHEALFAAAAPLRFMLQATDTLSPCSVVVVTVYPSQAQALGMSLALVLADVVLLAGEDVRIIIKNGWAYLMLHQPFYDGRRTRRTTGMQQHLVTTLRYNDGRLFQCSTFNVQSPRAFQILSLAALISWNFFSAALRMSSPRAATLSGWCSRANLR